MSFPRVYGVDLKSRTATLLPELGLHEIGATEPRDLESWLASAGDSVFGRHVLWLARQDSTTHEDRSDLVGVDENGAVLLAELKNGTVDEAALTQALTYASSYAQYSIDDLAELYLAHSSKKVGSSLFKTCSTLEDATEQIQTLVAAHEDRVVNDRQQILLVGTDFSARCLRVCDYLTQKSNGGLGVECWALRVVGNKSAPLLVVQRLFPAESADDLVTERLQATGDRKYARDQNRIRFVKAIKEALSGWVVHNHVAQTSRSPGRSYGFSITLSSQSDGKEHPEIVFEAARGQPPYLQFNDPYPRVPALSQRMTLKDYQSDWWYEWDAVAVQSDSALMVSEVQAAIEAVVAAHVKAPAAAPGEAG